MQETIDCMMRSGQLWLLKGAGDADARRFHYCVVASEANFLLYFHVCLAAIHTGY